MCMVSVVIPYYNNEDTIERALSSAVSQTYDDYEIILVDDGSTDNTHNIVDDFINKHTQLKISNNYQKNMGPSYARNSGIKMAKGKYIAFLDSDDEWLPQKLEKQVRIMEEKNIAMLGCNYYLIKGNKKFQFSFTGDNLKKIGFKKLLFKHYFATPCVVVRKNAIIDIGFFPQSQDYMEDSYVFSQIARKYGAFMINDFLVNIYKLPYGEKGLSSRLHEMEKFELINFKNFRKENDKYDEKLGRGLYVLASIFSLAKYIGRKTIVRLRNV